MKKFFLIFCLAAVNCLAAATYEVTEAKKVLNKDSSTAYYYVKVKVTISGTSEEGLHSFSKTEIDAMEAAGNDDLLKAHCEKVAAALEKRLDKRLADKAASEQVKTITFTIDPAKVAVEKAK